MRNVVEDLTCKILTGIRPAFLIVIVGNNEHVTESAKHSRTMMLPMGNTSDPNGVQATHGTRHHSVELSLTHHHVRLTTDNSGHVVQV